MAKRSWEDEEIFDGLVAGQQDSGRKFGFDIKTADISTCSTDEKPNSGSNERGAGEHSNVHAAMADEELPAEDGEVVARRPRGRPLGSKNKPKGAPSIGIREISDAIKSCVLEVPTGFDVIHILKLFVRRCPLGVVVMSGRGTVTNFTLARQPPAIGVIVNNTGRLFDIISLTGAFPCGADTQARGTGLIASLTDAEGKFVAGTVGSIIAYCPILLIVGTVRAIDQEALNVQPTQHFRPPAAATAAQHHFQSPTLMTVHQQIYSEPPPLITVQKQIRIMPMDKAVPNLGLGSVQPE